MRSPPNRRGGTTFLELSIALAMLLMVIPIVGQLALWSISQKTRMQSQQTAQELANNALESARARPFDELTAEWAAAQHVPDDMKPLLPEGTLKVTVKPEAKRLCRVTAKVTWQRDVSGPPHEVQLTTLIAPRPKIGGEP